MVNDKLIFPVSVVKTVEFIFNVSARNEDEAATIVDDMYMNGEFDNYFSEGDSLGVVGHTIDVGEMNLYAEPEIDENGWVE